MASIKQQLAKIAVKRKKDVEDIYRASVIRVGNQVITASPVDKGHFRNNWNTSIGNVSYSIKPDNKSGSDSLSELTQVIQDSVVGVVAYFNNPLIYGPRLEYDSYSQQAPNGCLRINTAKWESIVNEEVLKRR